MAAVLIKQIYSIDINSCFTTAVPRWKRCPTPPGKGSHPLPRTCSSQIPRASAEPATVLGERVSSAADSSEQRALQNRDSALYVFQKCWEIWKLTKNLSSLSLINVTRAVKVLTLMTKKSAIPLQISTECYQKDTLIGLGSGSSSSHCSSEFSLRLADTFIILLTLKSSAVCSFTMQNMILADKILPLIWVCADQSKTKNLGTDPIINSNTAKNALGWVAVSESVWTVLLKCHKARKAILNKYLKKLRAGGGGRNQHRETKSTIIPLNEPRINSSNNFSCIDCNG